MLIYRNTPVCGITTERIRFPQNYGMTHGVTLEEGTVVMILKIVHINRSYSSPDVLVTFLTPKGVIETRYWELRNDTDLVGIEAIETERV